MFDGLDIMAIRRFCDWLIDNGKICDCVEWKTDRVIAEYEQYKAESNCPKCFAMTCASGGHVRKCENHQ